MTVSDHTAPRLFSAALLGFVLGGLALIFVVFHFVSGPFAPQQDVSVTFGELASGMAKSAARDMIGLAQPAPEAVPWDLDRMLRGGAAVVAGLAIMLGVWGLVRHENTRLCSAAIVLGSGAIAAQFFTAVLFVIIGALILIAFFNMIGDWSPFG